MLGKKIFIVVLVFALVAITAFGGAGKYVLPSGEAAPREDTAEVFSPEQAIPASQSTNLRIAGIKDTRSIRKMMPYILLFGEAISRDLTLGGGGEDIAKGLSFIGRTEVFWDTADSVAVSVVSDDRFYASLSVDGEKFDKLMQGGFGGLLTLEKWDGAKVSYGRDAWIVKPSSPEITGGPFYMTRWSAGGRDAINIASGTEEIGEMAEAVKNPEKRLRVARLTEGENFISANLENRMEIGDFSVGQAETSWSLKDNLLEIRSYSDAYEPIASRLAGRTFSPEVAPTLGDGEVALFAAVDPALCCSVLFPAEPDPIKKALGLWGVPQEFSADIEAILANCRISAVVVAKDQALGTAYLAIETEARGSLDMLYMLAQSMLAEMEAVNPVQLGGWDSAFELRLDSQLKAIAARREGMVLMGLGEAVSFGKQAGVPAGAVPPADASRVFAVTAVSRILEVKAPGSEKTARELIEEYLASLNLSEALRATAWLDQIDRLDFTHFLDGRGEMNITFKERGI